MPDTPESPSALTDVGPTPPAWCEHGARPDWDSVTLDGAGLLTWTRDVGEVWIACEDTVEDGEWVRSPARIRFFEPPSEGLDSTQARRWAADLLSAAELLDELSAGGAR